MMHCTGRPDDLDLYQRIGAAGVVIALDAHADFEVQLDRHAHVDRYR